MKISDFHYDVPSELIALSAIEPRSSAKMMVLNRADKKTTHSTFIHLAEFLEPGSIIVVNESKVIPARFFAQRKSGAKLEGLLVQAAGELAEVWIKGKVIEGEVFNILGVGAVTVEQKEGKRVWLNISQQVLASKLKDHGVLPIPPYIEAERNKQNLKESDSDVKGYQTIFARDREGFSVAAPTASLHFDEALLEKLKSRGIEILKIALDVGEGTFAPVESSDLDSHKMHSEPVEIGSETWNKILSAKKEGRKIIAVGTTVMRSLESAAERARANKSNSTFRTDLFIRPPFQFQIVDHFITNFHWPDSTLVVLVATFLEAIDGKCPREIQHLWRKAYQEAIQLKYRLFSFGDGMLVL